jgi:acetoacetyl-CoA synthetase
MWQPDAARVAATNLTRFTAEVAERWQVALPDYMALWRFSVEEPEKFWTSLWDFCGVIAETRGERVLVDGEKMPGAKFFPDARLNFAENLLRRRDESPAMIFRAEDRVRSEMSWAELHAAVSRLRQALLDLGVGPGDRCAGYAPNMPETIVAMLAATSIGAIWTSCSPDFGRQGVLDRFGQTTPKVLFTVDGYFYNGKAHSALDKLRDFIGELPSVEKIVVWPLTGLESGAAPDLSGLDNAATLEDVVAPYAAGEIDFPQLPFDHPLYIMYSSGTTGVPKCIVHGAGASLIQHLKEHRLHADIRPGDRVFYFTTCGWMMWNWLASCLGSEATLALYDGAPSHPSTDVLFDYADEAAVDIFGTSAKFIDAIAKEGLRPVDSHDLSSVRTILSTGSTLVPEGFDYVYDAVKRDVLLSSMSGGTDLLGCFCAGNPNGPVWRGEIQAPVLGMAVDVFDEDGNSVRGEKGELVCTRAFPSMPLEFWGDADGAKYHAAYFERFPGIWCHGDFVSWTEHDGFVFYGRSDATLNPGGVRIGTAEIYRIVEGFDEVLEAIVVGQDWDNDTRVVLFVRLAEGVDLTDDLRDRIRKEVRARATPRHVPARILAVTDIPRTKSGKITELAVRDVVHGRAVKNQEALANPEALELFRDRPELAE